jgi:hypothetical protein
MSTIKVSNVQHGSAAAAAITLDANGQATLNGLAYPTSGSLSGRNRIINGDMRIDQRNAGASVSTSSGSSVYTVDRWQAQYEATSKYTIQQSTVAPAGFTNSLLVTSSSAYTPTATQWFAIAQSIEGLNMADLAWGTASAAAITISFWVRSSLTGTFGGSVTNAAWSRSYPFTFSISAANTWEQKTVTIAGETTGTWNSNTSTGLTLRFNLGTGSTYSGTAGAWAGSQVFAPTGATSVVGTNGATFYLTGVQLEAGSVATPFERRSYGQELVLCQRYYERLVNDRDGGGVQNIFIIYGIGSGNAASCTLSWAATKRVAPTVTVSNNTNTNITSLGVNSTTSNVTFQPAVTSAGMAQMAISAGATWLTASSEL